jgi:hypothetical protein
MALSIKTNRMLWGRAASRCSIPECRRDLVVDSLDTDDPSLVGEAAHIVAEEVDGPRGQSDLPLDQRNKYANLILLCNVHHKQVDDQVNHFTVDRLISIKSDHELWVRTTLSGFDPAKQAEDERWAAYIEEWAARADLDRWLNQTYSLLQPTPGVGEDFFSRLAALREWIFSRVWPNTHPDLRKALENFRVVVGDLVNVFERYSKPEGDGSFLSTDRFYRIREWNEERYKLLLNRYEFHVDLVHDLTYEMTRAANYVCDKVRQKLDRSFRIEQGVLLVRRGMTADMMEHTHRLEYRDRERVEYPYPGLQEFMNVRTSRDCHVGAGQQPAETAKQLGTGFSSLWIPPVPC